MNLFLPNLTFEDELQNSAAPPAPATRQAVHDLAPAMGLLADADDVVALDELPDPADVPPCLRHARFAAVAEAAAHSSPTAGIQLVPWGWTVAARTIAAQIGMSEQRIPASAAVVQANSRSFAAAYDSVLPDGADPFACECSLFGRLCRTLSECQAAVDEFHEAGFARWVAKPQISHAGRNRLLVTGRNRNDQQTGWLTKHLQHPEGVYLEPWVRVQEECGLQFEIDAPAAGSDVRLVGVTQLLNDHVGRYVGSVVRNDRFLEQHWAAAVKHGHAIVHAARDAGYFGPVGIDAFRFESADGRSAVRLCNDINARFTMGRLALQLRPWLLPGEIGLWTQVVATTLSQLPSMPPKLPSGTGFSDVRIVNTSPGQLGKRLVRRKTVLLAGPSLQRLTELFELLRSPRTPTAETNRNG